MSKAPTIYLVDDDQAVRLALGFLLEVEGFAVHSYDSAQAFLDDLPDIVAGCLITDMHMAGMTGLELLHRLRTLGCALPALVITGRSHAGLAAHVVDAGAARLVEKPFSPDEILEAVRTLVGSPTSGA